jgi:hypothetical protein
LKIKDEIKGSRMSEDEVNKLSKRGKNAVPAVGIVGIGEESLTIKVKGEEKRALVESKIKGQTEKRITRKPSKAMQIVFKEGKIVHLHCKSSDCGNEWKVKDTNDLGQKFDVQQNQQGTWTIRCRKCGRSYLSG